MVMDFFNLMHFNFYELSSLINELRFNRHLEVLSIYKKFLWRSIVRLIYVSVGPITETSTVIRMICKLEKQFLQSTLQDNYSSQII